MGYMDCWSRVAGTTVLCEISASSYGSQYRVLKLPANEEIVLTVKMIERI